MTEEQLIISREYLNSIDPKRDISCITDRNLNKNQYDLAVIIPCFNVEKYVKTAIDSVLKQKTTYRLEFIIVDDGSADETGTIVDEYGELENAFVIHQENGGLSSARNTGLIYADAKYICFMDSDDWMAPGALECMIKNAYEFDADIVQGKVKNVTEYQQLAELDGNNEIREIEPFNIDGFAVAKLYRAELFDGISFPESYWFEDAIVSYLIAPRVKNVYEIRNVVYAYRHNADGISKMSQNSNKAADAYWLREILLADMQKIGIEIDQIIYEKLLDEIALTYVRTNNMDLNAKVAIFYLTLSWMKDYCVNFKTRNKFQGPLEKAILLEDFNTYCDGCAIIWNNKISRGL